MSVDMSSHSSKVINHFLKKSFKNFVKTASYNSSFYNFFCFEGWISSPVSITASYVL